MSELKIDNLEDCEIIYLLDLTEAERKDYGFLNEEENSDATFFRYRGSCYYLGDFMRCNGQGSFADWDGHHGESFFSGKLVKFNKSNDGVKCASYSC